MCLGKVLMAGAPDYHSVHEPSKQDSLRIWKGWKIFITTLGESVSGLYYNGEYYLNRWYLTDSYHYIRLIGSIERYKLGFHAYTCEDDARSALKEIFNDEH